MTNFMNKYMKFLSVFAVVFALAPMTAKSQSMQEFLQSSYDNHPELLWHSHRAHQAYEQAFGNAAAGLLPRIDYTYRSTYRRDSTITSFEEGDLFTGSPEIEGRLNPRSKSDSINIRQNLFSSFSDYFELREFLDVAEAAKTGYYSGEQNFMLFAIDAYLNVIRADNIVKVRKANLASLEERLNIVERLYSVGDSTELDLRQSSVQLLNAQSALEEAEADYEAAQANFRRYGAIEADKNSMSIPAVLEDLIPASLEEAESLVVSNNFSVRNLDSLQKARKSAYRASLGGAGVSVDFNANYSETRGETGFHRGNPSNLRVATARTDNLSSTVSVTVPLYHAERGAIIRGAHSRYLEAKGAYSRTRLERVQFLQNYWASYTRRATSVELRRQAVESAEIALENVVLQQRAGLRSIVDVLDEENRLIGAQVNYETSRYEYLIASYRILSEIGRLTAKDLGLQTKYGEKLEASFSRKKFTGALPGIFSAVQGLGGEVLDLD